MHTVMLAVVRPFRARLLAIALREKTADCELRTNTQLLRG
jgi:hypothetical protein